MLVAHSEEKPNEMKLVMNKVKAKAKKFKDSLVKHGHNVFDHGHDHPNEDHHIPDDHDLDEDEEMDEDHEVHKAPSMFFSKSFAIRFTKYRRTIIFLLLFFLYPMK